MKITSAHLKHFPSASKLFSGPQVAGKTLLLKADLNVTLEDGTIQNPEKIAAAFPTLDHFLSLGADFVILTHLGRPKNGFDPKLSLRPVYDFLASHYGAHGVAFAGDTTSPTGPSRITLMENVRFAPAEKISPDEPAYQELVRSLLGLCDGRVIYEAAAVWDKHHASITGILRTAGLNNIAWGFHAHKEIIKSVHSFTGETPRPYVVHVSGEKPEKIKAIGGLLDNPRVDSVLVAGKLANAFLEAQGIPVGEATGSYDLEMVRAIMAHPRFKDIVSLPTDFVIAQPDSPDREVVGLNGIRPGFRQFDIGPETARNYVRILAEAQTAVSSGTAGAFDLKRNPFEDGTRTVLQGFTQAQNKIVLGGDGGRAARRYLSAKQLEEIDVNVGGGSILHFMAFQTCPVAEVFLELAGVT